MYPQDGARSAEVIRFHYFRENFTLSHSKERKEKNCLNCNTEVQGRYCHVCGQENTEPKESVWGLVAHFFYDITHFDGKFFSTLKYLVFRPGFLSKEYIKGRRASYLNPIRMYVFTSAIFFIIFFSVVHVDDIVHKESIDNKKDTTAKKKADPLKGAREAALKNADTKQDSADIIDALGSYRYDDTVSAAKDTAIRTVSKRKNGKGYKVSVGDYRSVAHYDSLQNALPAAERDNWLQRLITRRTIVLNNKYGRDGYSLMNAWVGVFLHQFPKLLFVSLPIFALILRLLYIRRRKQFYYADHGIFSIHLYIFCFVLLLISFGLAALSNVTGWSLFDWLQLPLWLYLVYYDYKALKIFYGQGTGKTLVKFILLNTLAFITILILFVAFIIVAAFQL